MGKSLRKAANELGIKDRQWFRGVVDSQGINLVWIGRSLVMSDKDFRRVKKVITRLREPAPAA